MGYIPATRHIRSRLYVGRPDGQTWEDLTDFLVSDLEINRGSIEEAGTEAGGADGALMQLSFNLQNDPQNRFSPLDRNSAWNQWGGLYVPLLSSMTEVQFQTLVTPIRTGVGVTPSRSDEPFLAPWFHLSPEEADPAWRTMFHGYLGEHLETSGPRINVRARDLAKRLQQQMIYDSPVFGSDAGTPLEQVIQDILDHAFGTNEIILYCPISPNWAVPKFQPEFKDVWSILWDLVKQCGWWVGYKWDPNTAQYRLTLLEPPRSKDLGSADFVLDASDVYVHTLSTSDDEVRNVVIVEYHDQNTGRVERVVVSDVAGSSVPVEIPMWISVNKTSQVRTAEAATRLANAALEDCKHGNALSILDMPYLPELDIFHGIALTNRDISSEQEFYGVVSVRHGFHFGEQGAKARTYAVCAGKVTGGYDRWMRMEARPGSPGYPVQSISTLHPDTPIWDTCEFVREVTLRWHPVSAAVEYEIRRTNADWGTELGRIWHGTETTAVITPLGRSETFYLKARDSHGLYSEVAAVKVITNDTPSTPGQPTVDVFFSALWITPTPVADTDVLGYHVYFTQVDEAGQPIGATQLVDRTNAQRFAFQAGVNTRWRIEVAAYDIIGEGSKSVPLTVQIRQLEESELGNEIVKAWHLAAGSIEAYVAAVQEAFIDSAHIIKLEANKISTDEAKIQAAQIESVKTEQIVVGVDTPLFNESSQYNAGVAPVVVDGTGGRLLINDQGGTWTRKSDGKVVFRFDANTGDAEYAGKLGAKIIEADDYKQVPVTDTYNVMDSFDASHPLEIPIYIDEAMTIHDVRITARGMRYRAYASGASAGGSHSHDVEIEDHTHTIPFAIVSVESQTAGIAVSVSDHSSHSHTYDKATKASAALADLKWSSGTHTHTFSDSGTVSISISGNTSYTGTLDYHAHSFSGSGSDSVEISGTTSASSNSYVYGLSQGLHEHSVTTTPETTGSGGSTSHVVTMVPFNGQHSHVVPLSLPLSATESGGAQIQTSTAADSHTHSLVYGIFDDTSANGLPRGVDLYLSNSESRSNYVKVADLPEPPSGVDEFQLCKELVLPVSLLERGWRWVKFTTTTKGRISAHIVIRGFQDSWLPEE